MKKRTFIIVATLVHAVVSFGLYLHAFSMGMRRFDSALSAGLGERLILIIAKILLCPIAYPAKFWFPKVNMGGLLAFVLGYSLLFLNSFIWAIAA